MNGTKTTRIVHLVRWKVTATATLFLSLTGNTVPLAPHHRFAGTVREVRVIPGKARGQGVPSTVAVVHPKTASATRKKELDKALVEGLVKVPEQFLGFWKDIAARGAVLVEGLVHENFFPVCLRGLQLEKFKHLASTQRVIKACRCSKYTIHHNFDLIAYSCWKCAIQRGPYFRDVGLGVDVEILEAHSKELVARKERQPLVQKGHIEANADAPRSRPAKMIPGPTREVYCEYGCFGTIQWRGK